MTWNGIHKKPISQFLFTVVRAVGYGPACLDLFFSQCAQSRQKIYCTIRVYWWEKPLLLLSCAVPNSHCDKMHAFATSWKKGIKEIINWQLNKGGKDPKSPSTKQSFNSSHPQWYEKKAFNNGIKIFTNWNINTFSWEGRLFKMPL